jgi:hypothetical protein
MNKQGVQTTKMTEAKESFAKSLFYIQLISLALAIISIFLMN